MMSLATCPSSITHMSTCICQTRTFHTNTLFKNTLFGLSQHLHMPHHQSYFRGCKSICKSYLIWINTQLISKQLGVQRDCTRLMIVYSTLRYSFICFCITSLVITLSNLKMHHTWVGETVRWSAELTQLVVQGLRRRQMMGMTSYFWYLIIFLSHAHLLTQTM